MSNYWGVCSGVQILNAEKYPVNINMPVVPSITVADKIFKKVHDIVLQDRQKRIRNVVEDTCLSYHVVHLSKELYIKKISTRWVLRMLTIDQKRNRMLTCERLLKSTKQTHKHY